jgi:hypothetical protein
MLHVISFLLSVSISVFAFVPNLQEWEDSFTFDQKYFSGEWSGGSTWQGKLCNGRAQYHGQVGGEVEEVRFQLKEGYIEARGSFRNLWGHLQGSYRSDKSLCIPVAGWTGITSDSGFIRAHIWLLKTRGSDIPNAKVAIQETRLGRMRFGLWLPAYVEHYLTWFINRALSEVWASRLGDWIHLKITEQIKETPPRFLRGEEEGEEEEPDKIHGFHRKGSLFY